MERTRPRRYTIFRLFYSLLFTAMGVGLVVLGYLVAQRPELLGDLLHLSPDAGLPVGIAGTVSLLFGIVTFHMIGERRKAGGERRQQQVEIDFPDRRSGLDRRGE